MIGNVAYRQEYYTFYRNRNTRHTKAITITCSLLLSFDVRCRRRRTDAVVWLFTVWTCRYESTKIIVYFRVFMLSLMGVIQSKMFTTMRHSKSYGSRGSGCVSLTANESLVSPTPIGHQHDALVSGWLCRNHNTGRVRARGH